MCVCAKHIERESRRESESEGDCAMCLLNEELVDCDLWSQNKHEAVADEELILASEELHARKLLASS